MINDYLIIHKSILPDYYEKVIDARRFLETGQAKDVSHAVKVAGISRSTYYKYKDYILQPSEVNNGRIAVMSFMLSHEPGVLSSLLTKISDAGGSVLTITQSLPIHSQAEVTVSLDVSAIHASMEEFTRALGNTPGVENPKLLAIE